MAARPNDPLLAAGKIVTTLVSALLLLVAVVLVLTIPAFLFSYKHVAEALDGNAANLPLVLATITGLLTLGAAVMAAAFMFFRYLGKIIDTVGQGDPFVDENADRLEKMGWIAAVFQVAAIPMMMAVAYLQTQFPEQEIQLDIELSATGVLLAIVLFILARVFRQGSAMREELEGTV
ncbi:DUF2975 domain-containing protein [Altererythrobacter luteolus]|uniref:DUF2975 domain-containing protein n=1 Tax=Pontixanthobacter luteolus TaxID=295089 RepID=A0A6I4V1X7_9SPHN|nr:DUF2975 domain-containing protein [Pontixanthobacter luteolus]MXP48167.1 DUF2975 domain-containing protein [Pontixanthobacter luteolus]